MLKCFSVISIVIPCEAEGPDKAFNCVCHTACTEARLAPSTLHWGKCSPSLCQGLTITPRHRNPSTGASQPMWPSMILPFTLLWIQGCCLQSPGGNPVVPGQFSSWGACGEVWEVPILQCRAEDCLLLGTWVKRRGDKGSKGSAGTAISLLAEWNNS